MNYDQYDDPLDHMITFFNGITSEAPIIEDAIFGLRAAGPSIACNISAAQKKALNWDANKVKLFLSMMIKIEIKASVNAVPAHGPAIMYGFSDAFTS